VKEDAANTEASKGRHVMDCETDLRRDWWEPMPFGAFEATLPERWSVIAPMLPDTHTSFVAQSRLFSFADFLAQSECAQSFGPTGSDVSTTLASARFKSLATVKLPGLSAGAI
jgi:hypothetical protein